MACIDCKIKDVQITFLKAETEHLKHPTERISTNHVNTLNRIANELGLQVNSDSPYRLVSSILYQVRINGKKLAESDMDMVKSIYDVFTKI